GGQVDEFHRFQRTRHLDGDVVGVEAVGLSVAVAAQRRHHGDDVVGEQGAEHVDVDALDLAGQLVVDAVQDAGGVGDEGVGVGAAQVVGGKAFLYFVGCGGCGCEVELTGGVACVAGVGVVGRGRAVLYGFGVSCET